jgi:hypothetical protein
MAVREDTAVRLVEITQRKADELFEELLAELRSGEPDGPFETVDLDANIAADDRPSGYDEAWSFDQVILADGGWMELRRADGETYGWPDSSVDTYHPLVTYTGTGGHTGLTLGLGYKNDGVVVGFVMGGGGGSKRGITVFFPTDDFDKSHEKISMIRGGGDSGRAGFSPSAALPNAYDGFKVEMLRDRVAGKWNVQSVVTDAGDFETMLNHTALQAKLRKIA